MHVSGWPYTCAHCQQVQDREHARLRVRLLQLVARLRCSVALNKPAALLLWLCNAGPNDSASVRYGAAQLRELFMPGSTGACRASILDPPCGRDVDATFRMPCAAPVLCTPTTRPDDYAPPPPPPPPRVNPPPPLRTCIRAPTNPPLHPRFPHLPPPPTPSFEPLPYDATRTPGKRTSRHCSAHVTHFLCHATPPRLLKMPCTLNSGHAADGANTRPPVPIYAQPPSAMLVPDARSHACTVLPQTMHRAQ